MTASLLNSEQLAEFARRGVLRVPGLLSADTVRRAREHVESRLARWRLSQDGTGLAGWPSAHLHVSKVIGNKHPALEALLDEPALRLAVDALLEGSALDRSIRRPQVLVTLPGADAWTVPTTWHVDLPRLATGRQPGVQLFTFLDTVEPRGGGTLVIAGSHHLLNERRLIRAKKLRELLRREPYFRALCDTAGAAEREHLVAQTWIVQGVPLEALELTGAPGDAYFTDLRLLHSGAPNASAHPRLMATHRFVRADVVHELWQAM